MPEDTKEQLGDGQDDFGQAARQLASAAKSAGASAGADAAANAAGAVVKAGVESGKAVSGVAVGTAAGGPWGAILAAAWSMRHTLFRVLVCVCMVLLIFVVLIISLPSIITNSLFGLDGNPGADGSSLLAVYTEMAGVVTDVIEEGHERAQEKVEQLMGDQFFLSIMGTDLAYQVDQILVVDPNDASALAIVPGQDYVTLMTCTPYGTNTHRLLVRGRRIPYTEEVVEEAETVAVATKAESTWQAEYKKGIMLGLGVLAEAIVIPVLIWQIHQHRRPRRKYRHEK